MNVINYFESLSLECDSLKNRVRSFIDDQHWPTDGEFKETIIRSMISRSISKNISVGRGFVVKNDSCSSQIDVLLYDNTRPVLYKDGDLVFIPSRSCKGIIEVKSEIRRHSLGKILYKLSQNAQFITSDCDIDNFFIGLFSFNTNYTFDDCEHILNALNRAASQNPKRIVNHLCLGNSIFAKYWDNNPEDNAQENYNHWHAYRLHNISIGYFIHNLLSYITNKDLVGNDNIWFPAGGKEDNGENYRRLGRLSLEQHVP